ETLHVAERCVLVEVELERVTDGHLGEVELGEGLELRCEAEPARTVGEEERLLAHAIARQEEPLVVPDGDGEHAVHAFQARRRAPARDTRTARPRGRWGSGGGPPSPPARGAAVPSCRSRR